MEKFKKFSDPATGLNPFLPIKTDLSILGHLLGLILFGFKFGFLLAIFIVIFLC